MGNQTIQELTSLDYQTSLIPKEVRNSLKKSKYKEILENLKLCWIKLISFKELYFNRLIGRGGFAAVYEGIYEKEKVAIK